MQLARERTLYSVISLIPLLLWCVRQVEVMLCANAVILSEGNPMWEEHALTM